MGNYSENTYDKAMLARMRGGTGLEEPGEDYYGLGCSRFHSADQSAAPAAVTNAPHGGEKIVVIDIVVSVDTAITVNLIDEVTGTVMMTLYLAENATGLIGPLGPWKLPSANSRLMVQTSDSGNIAVTVFYKSEK